MTTYVQILTNQECSSLLEDLVQCNKKNEYSYSYKCKSVRQSLVECAVKNKMGELGKDFMA